VAQLHGEIGMGHFSTSICTRDWPLWAATELFEAVSVEVGRQAVVRKRGTLKMARARLHYQIPNSFSIYVA